jgi:hypothetical protein
MNHLLNALSYLDSLRPSRRDDVLTAEWKGIQRRAWASLLFVAVGLMAGIVVANFLDSLTASPVLGWLAEGFRQPLAFAVLGGCGLALAFAVFSWWELYRFLHQHGGN